VLSRPGCSHVHARALALCSVASRTSLCLRHTLSSVCPLWTDMQAFVATRNDAVRCLADLQTCLSAARCPPVAACKHHFGPPTSHKHYHVPPPPPLRSPCLVFQCPPMPRSPCAPFAVLPTVAEAHGPCRTTFRKAYAMREAELPTSLHCCFRLEDVLGLLGITPGTKGWGVCRYLTLLGTGPGGGGARTGCWLCFLFFVPSPV
jgi:hypothetical protein